MTARRGQGNGTMADLGPSSTSTDPRVRRWRLQVMIDGKRAGVVFHGTKRDATRELPLWVARVTAAGPRVDGGNTTVNDLCTAWLAAKEGTIRANTLYGYDKQLDHLRRGMGDVRLADVTPTLCDDVMALARTRHGHTTARHLHVTCKQVFAWAVKRRMIADNPFGVVARPSKMRTHIQPPTDDQVSALLAAAAAIAPDDAVPHIRMIVALAVATGARRGEILGLRWSDVSLDGARPTLTIRAAIVNQPGQGARLQETTKTNRARRLTLDPVTAGELRAHRAAVAQHALAVGVALNGSSFVFPSVRTPEATDPTPLTTFDKSWRRVMARAGVAGVRFHDLRHYNATSLLAAGVDVRTIAERLGHASPAMTLDVYSAFVPRADEAAAVRIGMLRDTLREAR